LHGVAVTYRRALRTQMCPLMHGCDGWGGMRGGRRRPRTRACTRTSCTRMCTCIGRGKSRRFQVAQWHANRGYCERRHVTALLACMSTAQPPCRTANTRKHHLNRKKGIGNLFARPRGQGITARYVRHESRGKVVSTPYQIRRLRISVRCCPLTTRAAGEGQRCDRAHAPIAPGY